MKIEVVWGGADLQWLIELEVEEGTTIGEVIHQCSQNKMIPEEYIDPNRVGIFGQLSPPDQPLAGGDRIELYRPLKGDPKEIRRALAQVERAKKGSVV